MPAARPPWQRHALFILALCVVALIADLSFFESGFVFDNAGLLRDPRIQAVSSENVHLILTQEYWYRWSISGLYRPFATFSYLFNYAILGNGGEPAGYHWVNFLLHAANIVMVYALGLVLFEEMAAPAFAMAALWSLHPVLTESVTNIIGRTDLLAGFGVLGGLLCHIQAASARGTRKIGWLVALVLAAAIGLFSKESAVVLVAAMAIYDFTFWTAAPWRARVAGYLAGAPLIVGFFVARAHVLAKLPAMYVPFTDNPLMGAGVFGGRLTAIKVLGEYLWLLLWPARLSCDYSYNQIGLAAGKFQSWDDWEAVAALMACAAGAAVAWRCYSRAKPVFFFIAFFFATLAPTSNLLVLIGTIKAERFLYLPAVGFAGCLVMAIRAGYRRAPSTWPAPSVAIPVVVGVISIVFAARTYARNADWEDEGLLWTSAVHAAPSSFKAHMCLAIARDRRWEQTFQVDRSLAGLDQAIGEIDRSLEILASLPDDRKPFAPYLNAGSYYRQKGEALAVTKPGSGGMFDESQGWYRKSVAALSQAEKIETDFTRAMRSDEYGSFQVQMELGHTYVRLGEFRQALAAYDRGRRRRLDPQFFLAMADTERGMGEPRQAMISLMEGSVMDPGFAKFTEELVAMYQQADPGGCAVRNGGLDMHCPIVHDDLCTASRNMARLYREVGRATLAVEARRRAFAEFGCAAE